MGGARQSVHAGRRRTGRLMGGLMDVLLRGGRLVDGTGAPSRAADVAVAGNRIVAVRPPGELAAGAAEVVDLDGLMLAPGFIDVHTHYDAQILWDGDLTPSSWHGVTSVVMGNCGFGVAPTRPEHRDTIVRTLENVEGMSIEALNAGIDWSFETFPDYLATLESRRKRLNVGAFIGHSPLRLFVLGGDERPARARHDARAGARGDERRRYRPVHLPVGFAPGRVRPAGAEPVRRNRRGLRPRLGPRRGGPGRRAGDGRTWPVHRAVLADGGPVRHPGDLDGAARPVRAARCCTTHDRTGVSTPGRGLSAGGLPRDRDAGHPDRAGAAGRSRRVEGGARPPPGGASRRLQRTAVA